MSTHANIITKISETEYRVVYLHNDGYPAHAYKMLKEHYASNDAAVALSELGNLSVLNKSCEAPDGHSFNTPAAGCCIAYGRDRGEQKQGPATYGTLATALREADEIFKYYWNGKGWDVV